jgi:hypothetical protein
MGDPLRVVADDERRASQYRRRSLRIAIRQIERAELYVVALSSLELGDAGLDESVEQLLDHMRLLRHHLLQLKASA